jgi:hypothetical protein
MGCSCCYACRTVLPLCIVAISKEMGWNKSQSVSLSKPGSRSRGGSRQQIAPNFFVCTLSHSECTLEAPSECTLEAPSECTLEAPNIPPTFQESPPAP